MENDDSFIQPEQAAELIGITVGQLAQLRYKGGGPVFYKPHGRLVRYRRSEVLEWLSANRHERTDRLAARA